MAHGVAVILLSIHLLIYSALFHDDCKYVNFTALQCILSDVFSNKRTTNILNYEYESYNLVCILTLS